MRGEMRRINQCWLILAFLYGSTICFAAATEKPDAPSALTSSTVGNSGTPKDEIYIDDESLEGSGGRGEIRDDLEKEPDYSGSGLGPDDEDSTTNRHQTQLNTNRNNKDRGRGGSSLDAENGSGDGDDDDDDVDVEFDRHEEKKPKPLYPNTSDDEDIDIDDPRTNRKDKVNTHHSVESEIDLQEIDHNHSTDPPHSSSESNNEVFIMNTKAEDRTASFFAQPGILAAVIGGAVVGLLCAILVVMFIVYRMRKKDEGSYALDEPKRSPAVNSYAKNSNNREFYA
ncbi:syndecan [Lutzomyia longipalpis]|uniref:Syndecan n=1 Tax=Lutzomyia longipalpis TaxID=7200 RepID=A0A7G3AUA3_LUTLO|nr:syndecan [Lutzomyia longipalpis]